MGITDKFVFLYLGTLSVWQWPEAMFSLFAQFYQERPDSLFYLLLPHSDHKRAISLLKEHKLPPTSYIINEVPHSEVGSVIGVADAGFLLRKSHPVNLVSSPTKFGEYLAAGIPVIATHDIGDTSALIRNEKVGLIISSTDEGVGPQDFNRLLQFADDVTQVRNEWATRCMHVSQNVLEWNMYGKVIGEAYKNQILGEVAAQTINHELVKSKNLTRIGFEPEKSI